MTDNEIIKALECCVKFKCENCSFDDNSDFACTDILMKDALDLINRQRAEIEKLENIERFATKTVEKQEAEIERYKGVIKLLERDVADAKAEGAKEFAHLLIDKGEPGGVIHVSDIPDYVMELREGKK